MELLSVWLPVLLYAVGIVLLVILIILGIRLIKLLDKVDRVVDNIEDKVNSLNTTFSLIDKATDGIAMISDSLISTIVSTISKIFSSKKRKRKNEEEDYYE